MACFLCLFFKILFFVGSAKPKQDPGSGKKKKTYLNVTLGVVMFDFCSLVSTVHIFDKQNI